MLRTVEDQRRFSEHRIPRQEEQDLPNGPWRRPHERYLLKINLDLEVY